MQGEAMAHIHYLAGEIGPRPVGSTSNRAAADYIERVLAECGLEVERQDFSCPDWEHRGTTLELEGKELPALASPYSPACDVTAPAVALSSPAELRVAELAGRIAILHGALIQGGIPPRYAVYIQELPEVTRLLEEKRPAAVITVNQSLGSTLPAIEDWGFEIPSAAVPAEVGLPLLKNGRPLHLRIDARRSPGLSGNVVARRPGPRPERIVLCAHYDTKFGTPGAFDNATGVAVVLALAKYFSAHELACGLEFVAFTGEECGGVGNKAYWDRRGEEAGQMLAVVNVDGAGQLLGSTSITTLAAAQPFQDVVAACRDRYPGVVGVGPWYESDHSSFAWRGVPSVAISSVGMANVLHLAADTVDWVSAEKVEQVVSLVVELVEALQDRPQGWGR